MDSLVRFAGEELVLLSGDLSSGRKNNLRAALLSAAKYPCLWGCSGSEGDESLSLWEVVDSKDTRRPRLCDVLGVLLNIKPVSSIKARAAGDIEDVAVSLVLGVSRLGVEATYSGLSGRSNRLGSSNSYVDTIESFVGGVGLSPY